VIEVGADDLGQWHWAMISAAGRELIRRDGYASQAAAIGAARKYRAALFASAGRRDARQGACV